MSSNFKKKNESYSQKHQLKNAKNKSDEDKQILSSKKINFDELNDWDDIYKNMPPNPKQEENENKHDFSINTSDFTNRNDPQNFDSINISNLNQNELQARNAIITPIISKKETNEVRDSINLINNNKSNSNSNMPSTLFTYTKPVIEYTSTKITDNIAPINLANYEKSREADNKLKEEFRDSIEVKKSDIFTKNTNKIADNIDNLKNLKKELTKIEEEKSSMSYNLDLELERNINQENPQIQKIMEKNKISFDPQNNFPNNSNNLSFIDNTPINKNNISHHSEISQHIQQEILYNQQVFNKYGNNFQSNFNPNMFYQTPNFHYPTQNQFNYHQNNSTFNVNPYQPPLTQYDSQYPTFQSPYGFPQQCSPNDHYNAYQINNENSTLNQNQINFQINHQKISKKINKKKKENNKFQGNKIGIMEVSKNDTENKMERKKPNVNREKDTERINPAIKKKIKINKEILNNNVKLGGLGPNIGSEDWSTKNNKMNKIKEFSNGIRVNNKENIICSPKNRILNKVKVIEETENELNYSLDEFAKIEKDFIKDMGKDFDSKKRRSINKNIDKPHNNIIDCKVKEIKIEEKSLINAEINNNNSAVNITNYSSSTHKTGYSHIHTLRNLKKQNEIKGEETKDSNPIKFNKNNSVYDKNNENNGTKKIKTFVEKEKKPEKKARIKSAHSITKKEIERTNQNNKTHNTKENENSIQSQIKRAQSSDLRRNSNNQPKKEFNENKKKSNNDEGNGANDNKMVKYFYQNNEIESLYQNNQLLKQKVDKIKNFIYHIK